MRVAFKASVGAEPTESVSTDPGLPCRLLRPPDVGPLVSQVDTRLLGPRRTVTTAGSATVEADAGEKWAGLLPAGGGPLPATFDELTGSWFLVQARLSSSSTLERLVARLRGPGGDGRR